MRSPNVDVKWRSLPLFLVAYLVLNSHFFCLVQATFFDNYLRIRAYVAMKRSVDVDRSYLTATPRLLSQLESSMEHVKR